MTTETKFARTVEGVHLAYQVDGDGPIDILMLPVGFVPCDAMVEEPALARFLDGMTAFSRIIRLDFRGVGSSDPVSLSTPPTLEQRMEDVLVVLDIVGSERAVVFATSENCHVGALLAASHPDRLSHLVLVNSFARTLAAPDYPWGLEVDVDQLVDGFVSTDASQSSFDYLTLAVPAMAGDPDFRAWWDSAGHHGASPSTARALLRVAMQSDVREILPAINVPTLVIHRIENQIVPVEAARYLAERIPDAKLVELEGCEDLFWLGDATEILDEVQEFVTGQRPAAIPNRMLLSVLFTDLVGSTKEAARVGDSQWRDVLDQYERLVRRELNRHGGNEIKTMGDGFVATFDAPARAVRCACALRNGLTELSLTMRAGVHTGEVELRDRDIAGIAVHIGQRVSAIADGGDVLVTRTVVDLVAGSGLIFEDKGEHELRGVPGHWQLFAAS